MLGESGDRKSRLATYALVFAIVVIARSIALWWFFPPQGWHDLLNGFELGRVAANLAEGRGMSSPFAEGASPTSWFMPLAPLIWAGIFRSFGTFSNASLITLYGLDTVLAGAAACCWLWLIRAILLERSKGALPFIAVLLASLAPEHLVTLTRPWYWGLQKLGVAVMLICALRWYRSPNLKRGISLGVAAGATLLVNSVPLLLFAGLTIRSLLRSSERQKIVLTAVISMAVCIAMLLPWIIRNYSVHGAFVPLRLNTWVEIRQGNNPAGSIVQGMNSLHPNLNTHEREVYFQIGELAYAERARTESASYISSYPGEALKRTALRSVLFWISDLFHEGLYGERRWSEKTILEKGGEAAVLLTAIAPLVLFFTSYIAGWLRSVKDLWILTTPLVTLPIPYYISHIHPVYFASVKPILILVAVLGVGEAIRQKKGAQILP